MVFFEKCEKKFLTAREVANIIGISETTAYRLIKQMNSDLEKKGKIIVPGKISKRYFEEQVYL